MTSPDLVIVKSRSCRGTHDLTRKLLPLSRKKIQYLIRIRKLLTLTETLRSVALRARTTNRRRLTQSGHLSNLETLDFPLWVHPDTLLAERKLFVTVNVPTSIAAAALPVERLYVGTNVRLSIIVNDQF